MDIEIILPPDDDLDDDGNYIGNDPVFLKQEEDMAIHLNKREELMKNATTIDISEVNKRMHERIKQIEAEQAEARRLEKIRIDNMKCPLCKSQEKEHHVVRTSNGIIGPGHHSAPVMDYYVCKDCGIHYSDLNKKK